MDWGYMDRFVANTLSKNEQKRKDLDRFHKVHLSAPFCVSVCMVYQGVEGGFAIDDPDSSTILLV